MAMISPVPTRIEDILNAPTQYAIPSYQRDFKWGEGEARELVEDIESYRGNDAEQLFLGSFIFESVREQKTHIIDGQQRLTSLMLLLIACRMRARALSLQPLMAAIQSKLTFIDSATAQTLGFRFVASESIRAVFELMAADGWDGEFPAKIQKRHVKTQANKIRPIYQFFLSHVTAFQQHELSEFLRALYNSYVIKISLNSDEEAFSVFERTNARGMDLEAADLLKNYLFAQRVESIEERWKEIVLNSDGTLLRMLKYFYVSSHGYVQKPQLYRKLKSLGDKEGPEDLTAALVEFSRFFELTKHPSEDRASEYFNAIDIPAIAGKQDRYTAISAGLQALQEFGISQFVPVAFAAIEMARRSIDKPDSHAKALIRLFEALEKYHFVNNVVCGRVGNEVERLYAETCAKWATTADLPRAVDTFVMELRAKRASIEEFQGRFAEINYAPDTLAIICYIFDRLNNHGCEPAQRLKIYVPSIRDLRRSNNIEHFMPQSPPAGMALDEDTREAIDSIGNLLPLYFKTNSKLGNLSPTEKVRRLRSDLRNEIQNLVFVQNFLERYGAIADNWNADAIRGRASDLATDAYRKVWAL